MRCPTRLTRLLAVAGMAIASATIVPAASASAPPSILQGVSLPDVVAPLLPAVVSISITIPPPARSGPPTGDPLATEQPKREFGSGFIIDPAGYIVTNRHVVAGADQVTVTFDDGTSVPATVLATNERPDLALLKVDVGHTLPTVRFGNSDAARVGETVVAIGNPLGLSSSISVGVVSALNRNLNETMIDDFIQTDAAINHGNSGGPLFNLKGQVIGVNWALIAPGNDQGSSGLGLAIPSNDVSYVISQMRRYGRFRVGFVGLRMQQVTPDIAAVAGLPDAQGGIVTAIFPNSPAEQAKIRVGDIIMEYNHRRGTDVRALLRATGFTPPGTVVPVEIWRDHQPLTVNVTVGKWPDNGFDPAGPPISLEVAKGVDSSGRSPPMPSPIESKIGTGLHLAALTDAVRTLRRLSPAQEGVLVLEVVPGGYAAQAGINPGDFILRVRDDKVTTPQQVEDELTQARKAGLLSALVLVQTADRPHFVPIKLAGP